MYKMNEIFKIFGDEKTVRRKKMLFGCYSYNNNQGNEILYFCPEYKTIILKYNNRTLSLSEEYTLEDVDFLTKVLSFRPYIRRFVGKYNFERGYNIRNRLTNIYFYSSSNKLFFEIRYIINTEGLLGLPKYEVVNTGNKENFSIGDVEKCKEILEIINNLN